MRRIFKALADKGIPDYSMGMILTISERERLRRHLNCSRDCRWGQYMDGHIMCRQCGKSFDQMGRFKIEREDRRVALQDKEMVIQLEERE